MVTIWEPPTLTVPPCAHLELAFPKPLIKVAPPKARDIIAEKVGPDLVTILFQAIIAVI